MTSRRALEELQSTEMASRRATLDKFLESDDNEEEEETPDVDLEAEGKEEEETQDVSDKSRSSGHLDLDPIVETNCSLLPNISVNLTSDSTPIETEMKNDERMDNDGGCQDLYRHSLQTCANKTGWKRCRVSIHPLHSWHTWQSNPWIKPIWLNMILKAGL